LQTAGKYVANVAYADNFDFPCVFFRINLDTPTGGECSPAELLDDPVVGLVTMSDGVDRQTLELQAREFGRSVLSGLAPNAFVGAL
jgi:hypothetical protein